MLDALQDGVYIIASDYTVTYMNQAMVGLFGEGAGKKCYEVINHSAVRCPWCRADEIFDHGQPLHVELYVPVVNRHYQVTELPIRNQDGTLSKLSIYRDVTDNRDQARRLRATEEDYRRLFEHVGAGVYISSKEGKFLDANAALLEMLGYPKKEELLRMNLQRDLYVRPEDRFKFQQLIERDGRVIDYEVDFKRKDGTTLPVLLTSHVRYDARGQVLGYEGICVDQSQRKKMERQLREAHDFLNNVIQSSPNAIMGTDMAGNLIIWNKGAEETLGYPAEEVIDRMNVRQLYPEGVAQKVMRMMRMEQFGGRDKLRAFPMNFRRKDGAIVEGSLSASILHDETGVEIASVGIFVDLGERLEMERKLRQTQEQLLQSEKLAAMGRLTSQIAHEINNPLYGIMNTLELMKTEIAPTNKRRKLLDMSLSETMRLAEMLRKMLSFSKPDQEEKCPVTVNEVLDEILMLHEKQLREHDIKLVSEPTTDLPPVVASKNQLRQVFLNLVANARDAMPNGGTLTVATGLDTGRIRIRFADTGTGIRPEHLGQIFDTFFTTKTDSVRGVGLGLSVCYGFIQDHGGDIQVQSELDVGTTFTVFLPVITTSPA
jgi:PAS domain S-box-containing protein